MQGEEGGGVGTEWEESEGEGRIRKSKDRKVNKEGKILTEFLENKGWEIFNGCTRGDERKNSRSQEEWGAR